jgi:toxin FitB
MLILDTNVISETMRPEPSPAVIDWLSQHSSDELYVTTVTLGEILYGIELLPHSKRRAALETGAGRMFGQLLAGHILVFDEDAARVFAQIAARRKIQGRPMAELDAQIVAIAQSHGAALATRNTADFEGCGVRLVNPWQT